MNLNILKTTVDHIKLRNNLVDLVILILIYIISLINLIIILLINLCILKFQQHNNIHLNNIYQLFHFKLQVNNKFQILLKMM